MANWNDGRPNPYAPPLAAAPPVLAARPAEGDLPLASVGTRFAGNFLDGILFIPPLIPGGAVLLAGGDDMATVALVVVGVGAALFAAFQWYLVATTGQSLAKRWLSMRIVKLDGSPVNFVSGVVLRSWVLFPLQLIPYVGNLIGLVDAVMIFGQDRRCLHDRIAGTKVVTLRGF
jgi:uncharacterized RDD family membrane protein YckC